MDQIRNEAELQAEGTAQCPLCGSELKAGALFCDKCGASMAETMQNKNDTAEPPKARKFAFQPVMLFDAFGALSGLLSIIFSFIVYAADTGSWESSYSYGGDAYTGIQNAAAQAANNIQDLARIMRFGMGSVLLIAGLVLCCCFGAKLYTALKADKN